MAPRPATRARRRFLVRDSDILQSVLESFAKIFMHPLALALTVFVVTFVFAEIITSGNGPLEILIAYLTEEIKTGQLNKLEKWLLKSVGYIVAFVVSYKKKFVVVAALAIPVVLKPNYNNKIVGFVFGSVAVCLPSVHIYIFLSVALAFWAYTQLIVLRHKIFVILVSCVLVLINVDFEAVAVVHTKHNISGDPFAAFG